MAQGRVAQIINNANFCEINNLLSQSHDMEYIARHFHMDLPLAWALSLEGKTDFLSENARPLIRHTGFDYHRPII
ncbi:MAG: hypothetical protein KKD21_07975 [Proteobacteria bacterium]|nr:hypothetical protein [Pseudomonadota bacterium]MBU1696964.1 hypothetical protein [Pseudomonadota bacterium]